MGRLLPGPQFVYSARRTHRARTQRAPSGRRIECLDFRAACPTFILLTAPAASQHLSLDELYRLYDNCKAEFGEHTFKNVLYRGLEAKEYRLPPSAGARTIYDALVDACAAIPACSERPSTPDQGARAGGWQPSQYAADIQWEIVEEGGPRKTSTHALFQSCMSKSL